MVKVLYPESRVEEYEYRARYLRDEYHMSGDGPRSTEFRINKVLRHVPFEPNDKVLDIGPGKGMLFERIHERVHECCGVDVTPAMVQRLKEKFKDHKNVSFRTGLSSNLPYPDSSFDKVLMVGAFCLQETTTESMQTLKEIRRVAKSNATIYISDVCVVDESMLPPKHLSLSARIQRRLHHDGPVEFFISAKRYLSRKVRILLEREPIIVEPTKGIWFPEAEFREMCMKNSLEPKGFQTEMITGISNSRYDYLLRPFIKGAAFWHSFLEVIFGTNMEVYI